MKWPWDMFLSGLETLANALEIGEKVEALMLNNDDMEALRRKLKQLESIKDDKEEELQVAVSRTSKKPLSEFENWLENVERVKAEFHSIEQEVEQGGLGSKLLGKRVKKLSEEVKELIDQNSGFKGRLVLDAHENRFPFPVLGLVGQSFGTNMEKMMKYLMEDEGLNIGIFGLGGVGKTTLITHIYNELLKRKMEVYWVTVSQECSINVLQNRIAKAIGFRFSIEDEKMRAAALCDALKKKSKFILILDDMWEHFHLEKVGIPTSQENGSKLIITTRSKEVCSRMDCAEKIKVVPLSEKEAWELFEEKLGEKLPPNIIEIAKSIARECDGLPLGIITIASCMKEVDDISEWRKTLKELKESKASAPDMDTEVFHVLKFSYHRLGDSALQKCFLCCGLYPEDYKIRREWLINYLIDEGAIEERSRKEEFDKGHTMLNKLERVCLLEGGVDDKGYKYVKMHDLIRDMAIQLMETDTLVCSESKVLDPESCKTDLLRISVMNREAIEIPTDYSPMCPKLSSLLLLNQWSMESVSDPFFEQLHGLKILHLYPARIIKLPDSVSNLSNLTALSLRRCTRLKHVPSLAKLQALKKLDLCFTLVKEVPQGMERLRNLKYLGLFGCIIDEFPSGILPNLSGLQVLLLDPSTKVEVEEVAMLRRLETLCCRLFHLEFLEDEKVASLGDMGFGSLQLNDYCLWTHIPNTESCRVYDTGEELESVLYPGKRVIVGEYSLNYKRWELLDLQSYHGVGWLNEYAESLKIAVWHGIKYLFKLEHSSAVESIVDLCISDSPELKDLFSPSATISNGTFSLLHYFQIERCPNMKKLFPPGLLSNLQNLSYFVVSDCENMEELIAMEESQHSNDTSSFILPKLTRIDLDSLPKLKSICSRKLICDSLQSLWVNMCPQLKQIPLCLVSQQNEQTTPLDSLKKIKVGPIEWWEMVDLDHPNAKTILSESSLVSSLTEREISSAKSIRIFLSGF